MIKKITRLLEIGEQAKPGDKVYYHSAWLKIDTRSNIDEKSLPVKRETYVVELPEIPEGFRELTQEDIDKNIKGEVKTLVSTSKGFKWRVMEIDTKDFTLNLNIALIIKPIPKGLSKDNYKPGMKFRKKFVAFSSSDVDASGLFLDAKRENVSFETLNRDYQVFDERKGSWIFCSEYKE